MIVRQRSIDAEHTAGDNGRMTDDTGRGVEDQPRIWLRLEGFAALVAGLVLFIVLGGEWYWAAVLLFVPDLSLVGYLFDARVGALVYNVVHNWAVGLAVLGLGAWAGVVALELLGAILIAHVGMDRALGYGLKYPTAFRDTHPGRIGRA
jgi:hypothetical protein